MRTQKPRITILLYMQNSYMSEMSKLSKIMCWNFWEGGAWLSSDPGSNPISQQVKNNHNCDGFVFDTPGPFLCEALRFQASAASLNDHHFFLFSMLFKVNRSFCSAFQGSIIAILLFLSMSR
jgi:hypothetical protein